MIHTGDCVAVMAGMEPASVDAIVTDPPYGLEFMGKEWDKLVDKRDSTPHARASWNSHNATSGHTRRQIETTQDWHQRWATEAFRIAKPGAYLLAFGGTRTYHRMTCAIEDAGWIIRDCLVWAYASGFPKSRALLKPAWEPIVMARKPGPLRELAIEACRIGTGEGVSREGEPSAERRYSKGGNDGFAAMPGRRPVDGELGRWPANLILTDPIFDGDTPGVVGGGWQQGGGNPAWRSAEALDGSYHGNFGGGDTGLLPSDTEGTYSRFFLIPKAVRAEREPVLGGLPSRVVSVWGGDEDDLSPGKKSTIARRNIHPTVKPLDLMRHLVRLVTPTGGVVLDPFLGSGTTALAAEMEGFRWVGIEKEPEYVAIAEARLNGTQRGLGLEVS